MNVAKMETSAGPIYYYSLKELDSVARPTHELPFSIKILIEAIIRNKEKFDLTEENIVAIVKNYGSDRSQTEVPFLPSRVIMQDASGIPSLVDLASLRECLFKEGYLPEEVEPEVPVDLVIDHSVQVVHSGTEDAFEKNLQHEYEQNSERYEFLKWAQRSFENVEVVPPGNGIIHQINLESLSQVIICSEENGKFMAYPDTLIGTDSHTTMINALGVLGWGVGGIEAEGVMMGIPINLKLPSVCGVKLTGSLREGVTATDVALTITKLLREQSVVGSFVEFFGPGLRSLSLPDRATIANMAPEYGATMGFFPIDEETLRYLRMSGRSEDVCELVETYSKEQGLYYSQEIPPPSYERIITLSLDDIEASVSGPKRPQDKLPLHQVKQSFHQLVQQGETSYLDGKTQITGNKTQLRTGSLVIASITSCTNTANPVNMITAGLIAKKAASYGLSVPNYVQTSLAPGSKVVSMYLKESGLDYYMEKMRFYHVGYGCAVCVGNSGSLDPDLERTIQENNLVVASVLSGNRNFEGRIHPLVKANYLSSPPLVIAYALAGRVDINFYDEPLGKDPGGRTVYLKDIWPNRKEIQTVIDQSITPEMFSAVYRNIFHGDDKWENLPSKDGTLYHWDQESTYFKPSPFFDYIRRPGIDNITGARVLAVFDDLVTTDHISPVGPIQPKSLAGNYLKGYGVKEEDLNTYGSRRGNPDVLVRGTFANPRLRNKLVNTEGNVTKHFPSGQEMSMYEAAVKYREEGTPLLVIAGKQYGAGSARDWAAKGTHLLGVKVVIAESFERIHRSNLIMMGVLPLQFKQGQTKNSLHLSGEEVFTIDGLHEELQQQQDVEVTAVKDGEQMSFSVQVRLDTEAEVDCYKHGGIFPIIYEKRRKTVKQT